MKINALKNRVNDLIQLAHEVAEAFKPNTISAYELAVLKEQLHVGGISFFDNTFGKDHTFTKGFENALKGWE